MKLERIIAIIMLLLERDKIYGKQLAEMFDVSLRTIYRDIATINQAGIPILSTSGVNGGISIMKEYKVEKRIFSIADITALLMGLGFISTTLADDTITSTLVKIKSLIPEQQLNAITDKAAKVIFDSNSWMRNTNFQPKLQIIRQALHEQKQLSMEYPNSNGDVTQRNIEAHTLLFKENSWYLAAFCTKKQDFRLFKLSRITNLQLLDTTYTPRPLAPVQADFYNKMAQNILRIQLRIEASLLSKVMDFCSEQDIQPMENTIKNAMKSTIKSTLINDESAGNRQYLVDFPFTEDDYGYGTLLSFGEKCQCLHPPHVRSELQRKLQAMLQAYSL